MQAGMRIVGQTAANDWSFRSTKTLWEYTPGDIATKGNTWMTDKSPNADTLTRKGDSFDTGLKRAKMLSLAVPEIQMRAIPYKENQYIETYRIFWYTKESKSNEDYWRVVVLHHATVKKITFKDYSKTAGGLNSSYYEVLMKIDADTEYFDQTGSPK